MRKKVLGIQVIQTFFVIGMLIVALLEKNKILERSNGIMAFYIISILIFWFIILTMGITILIKNEKEMKDSTFNKKIFVIVFVFIFFELLFLGIFVGMIDNRIDKMEFSKHCEKTIASIYDIKEDFSLEYLGRNDDKNYRGIAKFTYYFNYLVNEQTYSGKFFESKETGTYNRAFAMSEAKKFKPQHKKGEEFTIYYNTKNPSDFRMSISYALEKTLNIILIMIIAIRIMFLCISIFKYKKEKKVVQLQPLSS